MYKVLDAYPEYQIYDNGQIYSLITNKFLKPGLNGAGYLFVNLRVCTKPYPKYKMERVHRLIAKAFIPNPNNYPCINHIDGNKLNNNVSNLEWCTYSYNNIHALKIGLRDSNRKISDLSEVFKDFISGKYTISALEDKYNWHTSVGFTRKYLHEYAISIGKEKEYLEARKSLKKISVASSAKGHEKSVLQYDENGNFIKEFSSRTLAAKELGVSLSSISKCCLGHISHVKHFIFKQKESLND